MLTLKQNQNLALKSVWKLRCTGLTSAHTAALHANILTEAEAFLKSAWKLRCTGLQAMQAEAYCVKSGDTLGDLHSSKLDDFFGS